MRLVDEKDNLRLIPIKPPMQSLQVWGVSRQAPLSKDEQTGVPEQFTELIDGATYKPGWYRDNRDNSELILSGARSTGTTLLALIHVTTSSFLSITT